MASPDICCNSEASYIRIGVYIFDEEEKSRYGLFSTVQSVGNESHNSGFRTILCL